MVFLQNQDLNNKHKMDLQQDKYLQLLGIKEEYKAQSKQEKDLRQELEGILLSLFSSFDLCCRSF